MTPSSSKRWSLHRSQGGSEDDPWDNYQCKHYDHPLAPGDVWIELGKLAYYTYVGAYSAPRRYVFVSPRGAGPSLSNQVRSHEALRDGLLDNWARYCRTGITALPIDLTTELRSHIEDLDFSTITVASPLTLIQQHSMTPYYVARFGGGLPERPAPPTPPEAFESTESVYIRALLDAYEDRLGVALPDPSSLADRQLAAHFVRSRREFYSAEALREFSRDNVPSGTFQGLLDDVYDGVVDVAMMSHADAVERLLGVVAQAKSLDLTSNALIVVTRSSDRGGMCHQLSNDERLRWRA